MRRGVVLFLLITMFLFAGCRNRSRDMDDLTNHPQLNQDMDAEQKPESQLQSPVNTGLSGTIEPTQTHVKSELSGTIETPQAPAITDPSEKMDITPSSNCSNEGMLKKYPEDPDGVIRCYIQGKYFNSSDDGKNRVNDYLFSPFQNITEIPFAKSDVSFNTITFEINKELETPNKTIYCVKNKNASHNPVYFSLIHTDDTWVIDDVALTLEELGRMCNIVLYPEAGIISEIFLGNNDEVVSISSSKQYILMKRSIFVEYVPAHEFYILQMDGQFIQKIGRTAYNIEPVWVDNTVYFTRIRDNESALLKKSNVATGEMKTLYEGLPQVTCLFTDNANNRLVLGENDSILVFDLSYDALLEPEMVIRGVYAFEAYDNAIIPDFYYMGDFLFIVEKRPAYQLVNIKNGDQKQFTDEWMKPKTGIALKGYDRIPFSNGNILLSGGDVTDIVNPIANIKKQMQDHEIYSYLQDKDYFYYWIGYRSFMIDSDKGVFSTIAHKKEGSKDYFYFLVNFEDDTITLIDLPLNTILVR